MKEIVETLLIALVLVILVVYLFLQDWRATLIPMLAVPVSLVGTFMFFPLFGFSINTLSLFGLVLAIGLVVDDAIVVVEAVQRHIEEGVAPKEAAVKAMEEISGPVDRHCAGALRGFRAHRLHPGHHRQALSAVRGHHRHLRDAVGVQCALAEPRAGGAAAAAQEAESRGLLARFFDWFNRYFERSTDGYVRLSGGMIRKGALVLVLLAACGVAGLFLGSRLPSSFLPDEDQGYIFVNMQLPNAASLQRTDDGGQRSGEDLWPARRASSTPPASLASACSASSETSYNAFIFVTLKPWERPQDPRRTVPGHRARLNQELGRLPERDWSSASRRRRFPASGPRADSHLSWRTVPARTSSFWPTTWTKFLAAARKRPEIGTVATTFLPSVPQEFVDVDRDKVIKQGVAINDVYQTIQTYHGRAVRQLLQRLRPQWQVYVEAEAIPDEHRECRPILRAQQRRARWCRFPR